MRRIVIFLLGLVLSGSVLSQEERKHIRQGNGHYEKGDFKKAEESYVEAMQKKPSSLEGAYNLGNATYRQGNYEDAANQFELTAKKDADKEATARSYHNLGNSLLQGKQYEKSIEAYKNALRNNPADMDTKYNLAYAQQMLAQQQQQEQNKDQEEEKDEENQDNNDQQEEEKDQQNQDQQDQQEKDQEQKEQEKNDQQQNEEDAKQNQEPKEGSRPDQISKEDAQRLLEALKNDEQKLQEKLKKKKLKATKIKIEKDW